MFLERTGEEIPRPAAVSIRVDHLLPPQNDRESVDQPNEAKTQSRTWRLILVFCAYAEIARDFVHGHVILYPVFFSLSFCSLWCERATPAMEEVDTIIIATLRDVGW